MIIMLFKLSWYCMRFIGYFMFYTIIMILEVFRLIPEVIFKRVRGIQKASDNMNINLNDLEFLKSVGVELTRHASKNASRYNEIITGLELQKKKQLERSKEAVYKGRAKNKDYAKSKKQLEYKKQVKVLENDNTYTDLV